MLQYDKRHTRKAKHTDQKRRFRQKIGGRVDCMAEPCADRSNGKREYSRQNRRVFWIQPTYGQQLTCYVSGYHCLLRLSASPGMGNEDLFMENLRGATLMTAAMLGFTVEDALICKTLDSI